VKTVVPIQALRAAAALSVVLVHFSETYWQMAGQARDPLYPLAAGVDLFFVISGFVMVYSSEYLFGKPGAPVIFLRNRIARIVPLYWGASTVAIVLMGTHTSLHAVIDSYLFIPFTNENGSLNPLFGVGWTLNFEMYFYAIFALCLFCRRTFALSVLGVALISAVLIGHEFWMQHSALIVWTDPLIVEFLLGALIAVLYRRGVTIPTALRIPIIGMAIITIFVTTSFFPVPELPSHYRWLQWGVPAAFIVAATVLGSQQWSTGALGTVARKAGDASYSLYLLHAIALTLCGIVVGHRGGFTGFFCLLSALIMVVPASFVCYHYFERPMTDFLRGKLSSSVAGGSSALGSIPIVAQG
jgi:exopolysaccharide production protein ExoZ